jgi:hypothetical protein
MDYRKITGWLLLGFALFGLFRAGTDIYLDLAARGEGLYPSVTAVKDDNIDGTGELAIFFFEGNAPCPVCDRIRRMTYSLFESEPDLLSRFSIKDVNVEEKGNERYILELELFSTSVVLAVESGGRIYRWKNLTGVWDLADDPKGFRDYMLGEIKIFTAEESVQ